MAYQNIPVSDGYQVVQQIANFASTLGWTIHRNEDNPFDVNYRILTLSSGGVYITLNGSGTVIYLNGHRGIDVAADWDAQPDQFLYYDNDGDRNNDYDERMLRTRVTMRVNPILSVHLFGSMSPQPYIYAAIEMEPGFYRHLVIGHFEKFGSSLGGTFWDVSAVYASNYASFPYRHRAPFLYNANVHYYNTQGGFDCQDDTGVAAFCKLGGKGPHFAGGCWGSEVNSFFVGSPIQFNARTPLMTPLVWVSNNGYRPFGTPPGFRYVNMTYFEAGDEFTIGTETWKVFPWARRKQGASDYGLSSPADEATGMYGIAYLKD